MNERQMQNALESLLVELMDAQRHERDEVRMPDGMGEIAEVEDFVQAGVLTRDKGLIIRMADGSEFDITITQSRA
jgi:hypothetical protein